MSEMANRPIGEHVGDYKNYLESIEVSKKHLKETLSRINRIVAECNIKKLSGVKPEKIRCWLKLLDEKNVAARTRNTYLSSLKAFIHWAKKENRISENPLVTLVKSNEKLDVRRQRRALTIEEIQRLLESAKSRPLNELKMIRIGSNKGKLLASVSPLVAKKAQLKGGQRALIYHFALNTGLRRSELSRLTWSHLKLNILPYSYVNLTASISKSGRDEIVPLRADLVAVLNQYKPDHSPDQKIFDTIPSMKVLKADLLAAGIDYVNHQGQVLDFHSLRYTFCTMLSQSGASPRMAQALMRHSDINLTMSTYTDPQLFDLKQAVESLPSFGTTDDADTARATGTCDVSHSDRFALGFALTSSISSQSCSSADRKGKREKMMTPKTY